jgi:arginine-tRNA-protein transferase
MNEPGTKINLRAPTRSEDSPPQNFYVLREMACHILPGMRERKVVTELAGGNAAATYGALSRGGFRRSHLFAYRPACRGCDACVPVRVAAKAYEPGKSLRRTARLNADLSIQVRPATATYEQYRLFTRYLNNRHPGGEMARMSFIDYRPMVEETAVETRIAEFRDEAGTLQAACLFDLLDDGTSAVYSFFEPYRPERGLGTYVVHWLIQATARWGGEYVYLGYWIENSRTMAYKTRYRPLESLTSAGWRRVSA